VPVPPSAGAASCGAGSKIVPPPLRRPPSEASHSRLLCRPQAFSPGAFLVRSP
jgi:hypothetical protein